VNFAKSFVRSPPSIDIDKINDFHEVTEDKINEYRTVAEDFCITQRLDEELVFHRATFPEACEDFSGWAFFSAPSGAFRVWPGVLARQGGGDCPEFDPRKRPWYQAASSGPKNAVIVLEASEPETDFTIAKEVTEALLGMFTFLDFINIVVFNDTAKSLGSNILIQAKRRNVDSFLQRLGDTKLAGNGAVVDYGNALSMAFSIFNQSLNVEELEELDDCQKVIIFMSHSQDCSETPGAKCSVADGGITPEGGARKKLLEKIEELQGAFSNHVALFTYSLGTHGDPGLLQQMACENGGVYSRFQDRHRDPLVPISAFFHFVSLAYANEDPIWSEPYIDAFGLGEVSSITMPIFAVEGNGNDPPRCFIGVAGHDVPTNDLDPRMHINDVINSLSDSRRCTKKGGPQDACKLQDLRGEHHQCQARLNLSRCYNFTDRSGEPALYTIPGDVTKSGASQLLDFKAANTSCSEKGGRLAVVDTLAKQQFFSGIVPPDRSWIGLTRSESVGEWRWADGKAVSSEALSRLWISEDALKDEQDGDRCAVLDPGSTVRNVRGSNCDQLLSFICEIRDPNSTECQGEIESVLYENLTETIGGKLEQLQNEEGGPLCEVFDDCGFEEVPIMQDVVCPLGTTRDYECCECTGEANP
ncbi:unnamed protein product, partial [Ostreobium quekettii]